MLQNLAKHYTGTTIQQKVEQAAGKLGASASAVKQGSSFISNAIRGSRRAYKKYSRQIDTTAPIEQQIESLCQTFNLASKKDWLLDYYVRDKSPDLKYRQVFFQEQIEDLNRENRHVFNFSALAASQFLFVNPLKEITYDTLSLGTLPYARAGLAGANLTMAGLAYYHAQKARNSILRGINNLEEREKEPELPKDWTSRICRKIPVASWFVDWGYTRRLKQYKKANKRREKANSTQMDREGREAESISSREKMYGTLYAANAVGSFGSSEFVLQTKEYVPIIGHAIDIIPGIAAWAGSMVNTGLSGVFAHKSFFGNDSKAKDRRINTLERHNDFLRKELGLS